MSWSCSGHDAMFNMMSNIETSNAIYQNDQGELDSIQMGFKFHKPPIDLETNKPFRVITKSKSDELRRYELRSMQFYTEHFMEHVELIRRKDKSSSITITTHKGSTKEFNIANGKTIVYKQTYNRTDDPKDNYSEFFTIDHGLILISHPSSDKTLIEYNGKNIKLEIEELVSKIKLDSIFYQTDRTKIFETWEEKY